MYQLTKWQILKVALIHCVLIWNILFQFSDDSSERYGPMDLLQTLHHSKAVWAGVWGLWAAHCHICPIFLLGPQPVRCVHGEEHYWILCTLGCQPKNNQRWDQLFSVLLIYFSPKRKCDTNLIYASNGKVQSQSVKNQCINVSMYPNESSVSRKNMAVVTSMSRCVCHFLACLCVL